MSSVVIRKGLIDAEKNASRAGTGHVWISRFRVPSHNGVPTRVGVIHIEEPIRLVVGMKSQAQEPPLAAAGNERGDVEKWPRDQLAALQDEDSSSLQSNEKSS